MTDFQVIAGMAFVIIALVAAIRGAAWLAGRRRRASDLDDFITPDQARRRFGP